MGDKIGKGCRPEKMRASIQRAHAVGQFFPRPKPMPEVERQLAEALAEEEKEGRLVAGLTYVGDISL